jgi:hypothetical protein
MKVVKFVDMCDLHKAARDGNLEEVDRILSIPGVRSAESLIIALLFDGTNRCRPSWFVLIYFIRQMAKPLIRMIGTIWVEPPCIWPPGRVMPLWSDVWRKPKEIHQHEQVLYR